MPIYDSSAELPESVLSWVDSTFLRRAGRALLAPSRR